MQLKKYKSDVFLKTYYIHFLLKTNKQTNIIVLTTTLSASLEIAANLH